MRRMYRAEIKDLMSQCTDQGIVPAVMELFDDLQEQHNLHRDALAKLKRHHKLLSDKVAGIQRTPEYAMKYVQSKLTYYKECRVYFEPEVGRISVHTNTDPEGYRDLELVGVYTSPYDRDAIREDIREVYKMHGGE